jgi:hypothetical protein
VRDQATSKAHRICLAHSNRSLTRRSYFAGEADLAEYRGSFVHWNIAEAGGYGCDNAEIGCWFVDRHSAGYVHENIVAQHMHANSLFEHRHQQRNAVGVHALRHPSSRGVFRRCDQRLKLDQHRTRSLDAGGYHRT